MFLSLYRDEATLYRDMSGESLHRRGYRDAAIYRAAFNERGGGRARAGGLGGRARQGETVDRRGSTRVRASRVGGPDVRLNVPDRSRAVGRDGGAGLVRADARGGEPRGGGFEAEGSEFEDDGRGGFVERRDTNPTLRTRSSGGPITTAPLDEVCGSGGDRRGGSAPRRKRCSREAGTEGRWAWPAEPPSPRGWTA